MNAHCNTYVHTSALTYTRVYVYAHPTSNKEGANMKATLPDGTILDGTFDEVTSAVREIQGKSTTHATSSDNKHSSNGTNGQQGTTVWTMKRAEALWKSLYGDQEKLVKFLLDKGGSASQSDIMKHLGLKTGNQLAGVRSSITRNARRETQYQAATVIEWATGADGKWHYKLVPEVHEFFKQIDYGTNTKKSS